MPAVTPVTTPVPEPTVALALLLLHVPPGVTSVNVIVAPSHKLPLPDIADGFAFTVTTALVVHPVPNE